MSLKGRSIHYKRESLEIIAMNWTCQIFYVCVTVHLLYNNINNQLDATITIY